MDQLRKIPLKSKIFTRSVRGVLSMMPARFVRGVDAIEFVITERSLDLGVGGGCGSLMLSIL